MKAFLSHSSVNKTFVEEVGNNLGRQHYLLDSHQFNIGQDFKDEIFRCLETADTFILFASKTALESKWVTYELDIAQDRRINGLLTNALVFLFEGVSHTDLPPWLQKGLVLSATSPTAVAREIATILDLRLGSTRSTYFFGRGLEKDKISKALNPIAQELPRILAIWGLPGIGRRTLIEDVARNFLQYLHTLFIKIESGDNLDDFIFKLAAEFEFYSNTQDLKEIRDKINAENESQKIARLSNYLAGINKRTFLTLIDSGGLLDDNGDPTFLLKIITDQVEKDKGIYLGLILRRLPAGNNAFNSSYIVTIYEHLKALNSDDIERLLVKLLTDRHIKYNSQQIKALAEYVRGYPPAAYYAADLAEKGGLDLLLSEPRPMINFRSRVLATALNGINPSSPKHSVLEILAFYSPLPLAVIGETAKLTAETLAEALRSFLHSSILEVDSDGFFRVSEPLIEASQHLFDRWKIPHLKIANGLAKYINEEGINRGGLDLLRSLFRAKKLANLDTTENEISFSADLVSLTGEFYHQRDYERALEIGAHALHDRPDNLDARSFIVRAHAQLGNYQEAHIEAKKIRDSGSIKLFYFLTGFINRLQLNLPEAIHNYEEALKRGRGGVALHRDLASCYFHTGDLVKAKEHLNLAQSSSDRKNRYIIDLLVTIAVASGDEAGARSALAELEEVDKQEFYLHRLSAVEFRFGSKTKAMEYANTAVQLTQRPTFAMLTQQIKCEIAAEDIENASKHLTDLKSRFSSTHRDILLGLQCKLELIREEFDNAEVIWQQISDKQKLASQALRRELITGLISSLSPDDIKYSEFEKELLLLNEKIGALNIDSFDEILE